MATVTERTRSLEFRREREPAWRQLEALVEQVERGGLRTLDEEELVALPRLHRAAVSGLSVARAISLDKNLLEYLEGLTARSYCCVYGVRRAPGEVLAQFFARRFPAAVRRAWRPLLLSFAFLLAGTLAGFALTMADPDRYDSFVGGMAQGRDFSASTEDLRAVLYDVDHGGRSQLAAFASFLFDNNARVGILCFALGFAFGVPVFYLLFTTGISLGAMTALYHSRGLSADWWGWILPHGITELGAIVLCGAAGLMQGAAVAFPGRRRRLDQLAKVGREAGLIVVGAVAMLLVAALIEGFFRQLVHDVAVRYSLAATTLVAWVAYFGLAGRRSAS